jgi:hypothetical protein
MKKILLFLACISSFAISQEKYFGDRQDLGIISDTRLTELSGIDPGIINENIFWVHNDSDEPDEIYGIDRTGKLIAILSFGKIHFTDLEDISVGSGPDSRKSYIYLGDVGDNDAVREYKCIYRFEEPLVLQGSDTVQILNIGSVDSLFFNFPDGKRDCEAIMYDEISKSMVMVSKREKNARVYSALLPATNNDTMNVQFVCELPFGSEGFQSSGVTGGDISNDGREILIRNYGKVYYFLRDEGVSLKDALSAAPIITPYIPEPQGEGVCVGANSEGFYTVSERSPLNITPHLYFYPRKNTAIDEGSIIKKEESILISDDCRLYNITGIPAILDAGGMPLFTGLYFRFCAGKNKSQLEKILILN